MKTQKYTLGQWVVMLVVAGGLYAITESFFMALGILILLIVVDFFILAKYETYRRRKDREKTQKDENEG